MRARHFNKGPSKPVEKKAPSKRRSVNIRCRSCWQDVAVQKECDPLQKCPLCGKKQTYIHSYVATPHKRKQRELEADDDGSSSPD